MRRLGVPMAANKRAKASVSGVHRNDLVVGFRVILAFKGETIPAESTLDTFRLNTRFILEISSAPMGVQGERSPRTGRLWRPILVTEEFACREIVLSPKLVSK